MEGLTLALVFYGIGFIFFLLSNIFDIPYHLGWVGAVFFCVLAFLIPIFKSLKDNLLNLQYSAFTIRKQHKQKIWINVGFGLFFFCTYIFSLMFSNWWFGNEGFLQELFSKERSPSSLIYRAIFIFGCNALLVHLVRLIFRYIAILRKL